MQLATREDVLHVCGTMWDRGRKELTALGIPPQQWLEGWKCRINRDDAVSFGEAILGWDWETPDVICTAFQATREFENPVVGKRITKELRKAIPDLMQRYGVRVICTYSLCIEPNAPKWFRLLGLEEDLTFKGEKRGPYTMRRFVRRA